MRPNLINRLKEEWNNLDPVDPLRGLIADAIDALVEQPAQQEPVAWKLVPREPTHEMLKAMDECSKEGYDERLYAGHAASVYMAAVDAAPTPPAQRKPLTDEEIILIVADCASSHQHTDIHFARAIEAAHGIKEKNNG